MDSLLVQIKHIWPHKSFVTTSDAFYVFNVGNAIFRKNIFFFHRIRQHLEDMECYVPGEEGETDLEDDEVQTSNVVHITQTTLSSGILGEEEDPNASFVVGSDGEKYYECREEFDH